MWKTEDASIQNETHGTRFTNQLRTIYFEQQPLLSLFEFLIVFRAVDTRQLGRVDAKSAGNIVQVNTIQYNTLRFRSGVIWFCTSMHYWTRNTLGSKVRLESTPRIFHRSKPTLPSAKTKIPKSAAAK